MTRLQKENSDYNAPFSASASIALPPLLPSSLSFPLLYCRQYVRFTGPGNSSHSSAGCCPCGHQECPSVHRSGTVQAFTLIHQYTVKRLAKNKEMEAIKAAKAAKSAKATATAPAGEKKVKEKKAREIEEAPFVNDTPPGEKKGA